MLAVLDQTALIAEPEFRAMSVNYIPDTGEFKMPEDPLLYEGYMLQQQLLRMEKVQETMPGQFNAGEYRRIFNSLIGVIKQIKERDDGEYQGADHSNEGGMVKGSTPGDAPQMGASELIELDPGISAENPFSR